MPDSFLNIADIDERIAIVRENLRELVEQSASRSGAADEDLDQTGLSLAAHVANYGLQSSVHPLHQNGSSVLCTPDNVVLGTCRRM